MLWIQRQFRERIKHRLPLLIERAGSGNWNFRCPLCGDSKKNPKKRRGYLVEERDTLMFYCHNCNKSYPFDVFLRLLDRNVHAEYVTERFVNGDPVEQKRRSPKQPLVYKTIKPLDKLIKISNLPVYHKAKKYVVERQIPTDYHHKLFYCAKFKQWTNQMIPDKFEHEENDQPRLIIPMVDRDGELIGYQGRAIDPSVEKKLRYITIILDESKPHLYGLDNCDTNFEFCVTEGPIDSMFINNSLASCGGLIPRELLQIPGSHQNAIIVYDNEPRKPDVINRMTSAIEQGFRVCIWPEDITESDINKMVLRMAPNSFINTEKVKRAGQWIRDQIERNSFRGLEAKLRLAKWKKS